MSNRGALIFILSILAIVIGLVPNLPKFQRASSSSSLSLKSQKVLKPPQQKKLKPAVIKKEVKKIKGFQPKSKPAMAKVVKTIPISESTQPEERSPQNYLCQVTLSSKALEDPLINSFVNRYQCSAK